MNRFYKFALACLASLTLVAPTAFADESGHGFSALFVFGDSLSDSGNSHADTGRTAHPPFEPIPNDSYGIGGHHYSNGKTWVEILAKEMGLINSAKPAMRNPLFGNYAYGGARARDYLVDSKPDFSAQVQSFLAARNYVAPSDALYVIQFGGNDLRDALTAALMQQDFMAILEDAIGAVVTNIGILSQRGARKFLIVSAPNLGASPAVPDDFKSLVAGLSFGYNQGLTDALAFYFPQGLEFYYLDLFEFVTAATTTPEGFGFTNVVSPCLTYYVTEGAFCENRDGHLFWDDAHPTKAAHKIIGGIAANALPD